MRRFSIIALGATVGLVLAACDDATTTQSVLYQKDPDGTQYSMNVWGSETAIKCLTCGFATPRPRRASTS